jgi:hypothetical protein
MAERPAVAGEYCTCGRPAVTVFITDGVGEVGACLISDGGRGGPWPCVFCGGTEDHGRGERCPAYRLRRGGGHGTP